MHQVADIGLTPVSVAHRNGLQLAVVGLVIFLAPLWWALGVNLVVYHLTALLCFGLLVIDAAYENRRIRVPATSWLLLSVATIYAFSIIVNGPQYGMMRIVAATNNLTYWIAGAMLVMVVSDRFRLSYLKNLLRLFPALGVLNVLIALLTLAAMAIGVGELSIPTPFKSVSGVLGDTALVEYSTHMRIITADYFSEQNVPRFNLYAPYPTAAGAFFMISLPMLVAWGFQDRRWPSFLFLLLFSGHLLGLGMTLARMAILALMASTLGIYVLQKQRVWLWIMGVGIATVFCAPVLLQLADRVVTSRQGSSESRFDLYRDSLAQIEGLEWITGRGIRTHSAEHGMPYGSHSTYVSLTYRTGLLGLSAFLLLQMVVFYRWYQLKAKTQSTRQLRIYWRSLGVVLLSMPMWMITEDIDVPQLLAFMYFAAVGLLEGLRRELNTTADELPDAPLSPMAAYPSKKCTLEQGEAI